MSSSSSSSQPTLHDLQSETKLKQVLADQQKDYDCLRCRLMGSIAFTGLGIYSYASGMKQLRERELEILKSGSRFGLGARRGGIVGMSAVLVGLGVYRLVN
ncbi:hypothetical protein M409DRAFT_52419 [Zasmidium cellare ATCC 36951]|uniref:Distal membrane-arm assembly complex protein 1-like domain-containing protein n=1 Tax=Zasmidium cellare ATCC 36951 TaxID=1080233 RepID=A0A6A6CR20_ZASCE|nr:uncharacterized protein M409DRAFT_52419 [Zasmidium cellare ATCC 36951]KAF2169133.1 hypothetical protein M409DRAFT_52419 [Zasmidium cellare ATCC 36951]